MTTEFRTDGHRSLLRSDLPKQERLLAGVAEATRQLLAIADFDTAVNGALEAIATAANIDRIFVYQNHIEPDSLRESATCPYEWTTTGVVKARELPHQFPLFYDEIEGYREWLSELKTGQPVQKLAREMSGLGQDKQVQEQALSVLTVPIFVEGDYWGNFGFDDCTTERVWNEVEIAVLETAAASFAGALERRKNVAELQRQDALLKSVNEAAQCLVATGELEQAIPEALQILGEETQQDRVYVFENVFPNGPDGVFWEIPYEWVNTGIPTVKVTTTEWPIAMASFPPIVNDSFSTGQAVQFLTRDLQGKAQRINEKGQTLSLLAVPITVSNQWWGVLGFDDCTTERQWSDAEIAVLQTAAACIGGAIERDHTRKDREIAAQTHAAELEAHNLELASRDRILQATASASSALLNGEDFDASVKAALQLLGESIGLDRIAVGQQMSDPTENTSGYIHFLYEWDGLGVISQIQNYEDMTDFHWDAMGLGSWYQACLRGEAFGQVIDELPEPFRSLMQSVDVKSTHNVPIFVEGVFWGVFGIDNCREKRLLSSVELTALKTAANCVGSAIARDRARREREAAAKARAAELAERDRILEASAAAANIMLTEEDFDNAVNRALQIIGVGLAVDRVGLMKHFGAIADTPGYHQQIYEYDAAGISEQINHAELARVSDNGMEFVVEQLVRGEVFGGVVDELPEPFRSGQQELGAQSVYAIPIIVQDHYWGIVALDDCHNETRRSEAELEALRTLANCIGNAIERDNARKEKEAVAQARVAELAERDRILEATAAAANVMLTEEDFDQAVKAALQIVGEGLEVDRINLGQYFEATSPQDVGYHDLSKYEWTSTQTVLQSDHPELSRISNTGMEFLLEELLRGEVFGGIVEELPEPFRSSQLALGVQSTYAVPIRVDGAYWGLIGFDDCHHLTRRSEAELEALITLANCIGNAIERERERQEKKATAAARLTELAERDRILETTATAANVMLTDENFNTAVHTALAIVGNGLEMDRVLLGQHVDTLLAPEPNYIQFLYEWVAEGTSLQTEHPELRKISDEGLELIYEALSRGKIFGGIVDELPEPFRSGQIELGVKSTYSVPVMVGGDYWGVIALDDCHHLTRRSEAELEALRTLANCIANAIARDRTRKEKEAAAKARVAELAKRDRILAATAAAANVMLTDEDFDCAVNAALSIVGEGLTVDRIALGKYTEASSPQDVGYHRFLYEWDSDDTSVQLEHSELATITDEGVEQLVAAMKRGEVSGGVVDEMEEPFRSKQKELEVQSTYAVPIRINGQYWGMIGFDDCHAPTRRSEAELEALMTLANCIGSAIERDLTRKEREAAAQAYAAELETHNLALANRDRILEATAAAANVLLTDEDFEDAFNQSLKIIGEAVGTDRVGLAQHLEDLTDTQPGHWRVIHEWCAPQIASVAQIFYPEPMQGTYAGAEQLYRMHQRGEGFSLTTDQMLEPFRSGMAAAGVQTLHAVPIILSDQYWGTVVFGDCRQQRQRSLAELAALQTVADCIGSAIDRDLNRKEREAATQARAAELKKNNDILSQRDRWLSTTAAATEKLLSENDLISAVKPALQEIGESIGVDRIGIMHVFEQDSQQVLGFFEEWIHPSQPVQSENEELSAIPCHLIGEQHFKTLLDGQWYGGDIEDFPEPFRSSQKDIGVQSTYSVPIFIDSQFWGLVGIDHCREKKLLTTTEIAVFQTIASCFASAIQRDQIRKAREAAERTALVERERAARAAELEAANQVLTIRDRWLQTTAAAANQLLSTAEISRGVNTALQTLGTNLESDRLGVMRHIPDATELGHFQILYEWDGSGTTCQIDNVELNQMPASDFADWARRLMVGQPAGGLIEEQSEPFRSKMQSLDTLAAYAVPIFIEEEFWGVMFMDYCRELRQLTPAELAVFNTAATCIGSAIHRDQMRRDREQAERDTLLQQEREQAAQKRAIALETYNRKLQQRDRLLNSVNASAQSLVANEDLETALPAMLKILGEGTGQCRAYILRNSQDEKTGELLFNLMLEWDAPYIPAKMEVGARFPVPIDRFPDRLTTPLKAGQATQFLASELDGISPAERQPGQALSLVGVPISVGGKWWGLLGLDDCIEERIWSDAEIAVLETAAAAVGGAVERDRSRQDREVAERTALIERERAARADELEAANQVLQTRERWLETTTTAANVLLSGTDVSASVNAALQTIGENLECDRVFVVQGMTKTNGPADELGFACLTHEWYSDGLEPHMDIPHIAKVPIEGFEETLEQVRNGQWFGGIVDELPEPMRSYQQSLGVKSMYSVPVFVNGRPWGLVGINHCYQAKQLSQSELAVFQTAATCIGSAIYQDTVRRDQAAQERAKLLGAVAEAANLLLRSADFTSVLPKVVTLLGEAVECDRCSIISTQNYPVKSACPIYFVAEWCKDDVLSALDATPELVEATWQQFPELYEQLLHEEVANYWVTELSEPNRNLFESQNISSIVYLPIIVDGKPWGQIGFDNCGKRQLYDESEIAILRVAAENIAAAISRQAQNEALRKSEQAILAEQEKAARERAAELAKTNEAIGRALVALTETPELGEFLGQILTQMINQVEACKAHLFLYDEASDTLHQYMAIQDGQVYQGTAPTDPDIFRHPVPSKISSAWEMIVNSPKPFTLDEHHPEAAEAYWPESIPWHQAEGHLSSTCACMKVGGKPIGFIGFAFRHVAVLSDEQLEFIQALTNQATLSIHLTRLAEKAKQAAISQEQEKAAQERVAELAKANEAISKSLTTLAASPELDQFLGTIIEEMARQVGACKIHLFLYDEPTHTLTQRVAVQDGQIYLGAGPNDPEMFSHPIPADITPGWNAIINGEHPVIYDETQPYDEEIWWPETLGWHKAQGHKAVTAIPMKAGDMPIGYIGFCFYDRTVLSEEQLEFMQALANQAIVAIQLTHLADEAKQTAILQEQERAARERAVELAKTNEAISKTLDALTTTPELNEFLGQILTQIIEQIGADDTHLFLYDAETHILRSQLAVQNNTVYLGNAPNDPELFYTEIPANITAAWQILVNAPRPVTLDENNPDSAEFFWPTTLEWHTSRGHQSATCACMKIGNQPIGFIGFAFCDRTVLTNEQLEFVQALTNQATLAIHLTRLAEQARTNALTDERNRLAREIHDTLAQAFTGISLQLEAAKNILVQQPETAKSYLDQARDLTRQGLSEARRSVHALRSQALETESLAKALQKNLTQMTLNTSLQTEFQIQGHPTLLEEGLQLNLLRIGQEAITNVLRHAQAQTLTVTLHFTEQQVSLCIVDDGVGFEPQDSADITGFGLVGIHERTARYHGQVQIISQPGKGTTIEVIMPAQPQTYAPNGKVDSRSGG